MGKQDIDLMAHLMRRAGFGATRDEIDEYVAQGYEATVEKLLSPGDPTWMGDFMVRRFDHEASGMINHRGGARSWLYRMITTSAPLQEKLTLFWHGIFATGVPKVINGRVLYDQVNMFRRNGMGSFDKLLLELSKNPAMIVWLDNQDNHNGAINENWGRELLELFSMGVGSYSEEDIKECSRAFTGWTIGNTEYMMVRSQRDSDWPYGRISYHFEYRPEDHDEGEKTFLGQKGNFNGEDIIDIICKQESTARFIARHMYHFFVADEPPVPAWPYTPPRDPDAIDTLVKAYSESNYDITSMLRVLFNSDFFKSEGIRYEKVKGPAEFVVGVLRLTGEFDRPRREMVSRYSQITWMGQELNNPPSVEGWHQGTEWVDTGTLIERINFASEQFGDANKPGVKAIVDKVFAGGGDDMTPDQLVDLCLEQMGAISVSDETHDVLTRFAKQGGRSEQDVAHVLRMTAATKEFQRA
ncbi:MAG: hypothetical protein BZY79_02220 [SAR202 cluster bacterium Casp-Chloro-G4]|nr:DUF1800 domain-containing protein [Chloroflexota bacterium]MDA1228450.1 DUF1800 domain-containing protein [Chloroflexota bacterium]PKB61747.1 MAG: hypothetical protein BZY79_02220 [SAR202 cluster bacterium Casp-Chloro-G4]